MLQQCFGVFSMAVIILFIVLMARYADEHSTTANAAGTDPIVTVFSYATTQTGRVSSAFSRVSKQNSPMRLRLRGCFYLPEHRWLVSGVRGLELPKECDSPGLSGRPEH